METIVTAAKKIATNIQKNIPFYKHNSLVICGENAFGKTTLIRKIIDGLMENDAFDFYYIDPQNRMLYDENNTAAQSLHQMQIRSIVENRIKESNFTIRDVFEGVSPGTAVVYKSIIEKFDRYQELFEKNLGIDLVLNYEEDGLGLTEILVNGDRELYKLATSEAARMRILFEVDYAVKQGAKLIIIDELDTYLSDDTTFKFVKMLSENYLNMDFVVSIHSLTLLLQLSGFDGALICDAKKENKEENFVRFFDVDSINELGQIDKIKRMFEAVSLVNKLEEIVSRLIETGVKTQSDVSFLDQLCRDELSGREKILYDYAKEVISSCESNCQQSLK